MKTTQWKRIAQFLYEVGTIRKLARIHRQLLLTDDMSDNISSHSFRVAMIGWHLAKAEKLDPYKVTMMCLLHDLGEIRSADHTWVHKRYVKIFDDEIAQEQLGNLPFSELKDFLDEYEERKSPEAIIAKEADLIDQLLLLKEYSHQGNKEADIWLGGKGRKGKKGNEYLNKLQSKSGIRLATAILKEEPSSWWKDIWTSTRR